jgi:tRNA threonylcarbamoyladenosine modification (KEOPS) complex  Pcc1 subunit
MNELTVRLKIDEDAAKACLSSILPEIDADTHERTNITLKYDKELILHISAKDLHAMRAAANTYIRWLDMCVKIAK